MHHLPVLLWSTVGLFLASNLEYAYHYICQQCYKQSIWFCISDISNMLKLPTPNFRPQYQKAVRTLNNRHPHTDGTDFIPSTADTEGNKAIIGASRKSTDSLLFIVCRIRGRIAWKSFLTSKNSYQNFTSLMVVS